MCVYPFPWFRDLEDFVVILTKRGGINMHQEPISAILLAYCHKFEAVHIFFFFFYKTMFWWDCGTKQSVVELVRSKWCASSGVSHCFRGLPSSLGDCRDRRFYLALRVVGTWQLPHLDVTAKCFQGLQCFLELWGDSFFFPSYVFLLSTLQVLIYAAVLTFAIHKNFPLILTWYTKAWKKQSQWLRLLDNIKGSCA